MGLRWSRKGAKDNTKRLAKVRYLKYILEGEEYYIKEKSYVTYCDGWIDEKLIIKSTYENAIKKGKYECEEMVVEKDILSVSMRDIALIYSKKYKFNIAHAEKSANRAKKAVELIRKNCDISSSTEYRIFNKVFNYHIDILEKEKDVIWNALNAEKKSES